MLGARARSRHGRAFVSCHVRLRPKRRVEPCGLLTLAPWSSRCSSQGIEPASPAGQIRAKAEVVHFSLPDTGAMLGAARQRRLVFRPLRSAASLSQVTYKVLQRTWPPAALTSISSSARAAAHFQLERPMVSGALRHRCGRERLLHDPEHGLRLPSATGCRPPSSRRRSSTRPWCGPVGSRSR